MKITLADEIILYRHVKYKGITLNIFELGKKYMKGLRVDPLQFLLDTFSASWRRWNAKSTCQNLIRSSWNILSPARLYCSKTAQQAASGSFLTRDGGAAGRRLSERGKMGLTRRLLAFFRRSTQRKGCVCVWLSRPGRKRERKSEEKSPPFTPQLAPIYSFSTPWVCFFLATLLLDFLRAPTARDEIFILTPHILWDAPSCADGNRDKTQRLSFALASISSLAPASALCARCGRFFPLSPHQRSLFYTSLILRLFYSAGRSRCHRAKCALPCAHVHWIRFFPRCMCDFGIS
jgi:hypothetical protein